MAANSGLLVTANTDLSGAVGLRNRVQNVANSARDQAKLIRLLAAIPDSQGGKRDSWPTPPLAGADRQCARPLADAIWDFQVFWKKRGRFSVIDGVVDPGKSSLRRMNELVNGPPEPSARRVQYEVPLVSQGQNPICWVCCMAMVASERRHVSVGVGTYIRGFDPSLGSIPNPVPALPPALIYPDYVARLDRCGFTSMHIDTAEALEETLRERGPLILSHACAGFPYNVGFVPPLPPGAAHAVVLTGVDLDSGAGFARMNNPWGYKNVPISVAAVLAAGRRMQSIAPAFAWYRPTAKVS